MSSSTTSAGGDGSDNTQNFLGAAALAVSLVALVVSTFQLLQQYYASANGLTSCSEIVIGKWAQFTRRKFLWKEFRFEVRFCTPVLFVSPPDNKYGPLGDSDTQEIIYLNGSNHDRTHTWTLEEYDILSKAKLTGPATRETVHTADNELSSWVTLLMAIQRMERESAEWDESINKDVQPLPGYGVPTVNKKAKVHTLAVGMQEKRRTWDAMPGDMKKPYATSAMCHLIEIMAMLGIYWKEFDRSSNTYRAQGNGYIVTGSMVPNLGIAFTFEVNGKTWFHENRVVPNDLVKQLCFGYCPTIFQDGFNIPVYADEPADEGTLQLATKAEIAETLVSFSCNTNTVNYFRLGSDHTRYSHLFPVPFEMLGMLGKTLQMAETPFTMLPNPTLYHWDKSAMSLVNMLDSFRKLLKTSLADNADNADNAGNAGNTDNVEDSHGGVGGVFAVIRNTPRLRRIVQDAKIAVDATSRDRKRKNVNSGAQRVAEEKRRLLQKEKDIQKPNDASADAMQHGAQSAPASPSLTLVIKVVTVVAWFCQPALLLLRPLALLAVHIGSEFHKLLVKIEVVQDEHAEKLKTHIRHLAQNVEARPSKQMMVDALRDAIKRCDEFLLENKKHTGYVFALHMEELMCYLNSRRNDQDAPDDGTRNGNAGPLPRSGYSAHIYSPPASDTDYYNSDYTPLHAIDTAAWADRDELLMKVYLHFIRKRVLKTPIPKRLKMYSPIDPDPPGPSGGVPGGVPSPAREDSSSMSGGARQMAPTAFETNERDRSQKAAQKAAQDIANRDAEPAPETAAAAAAAASLGPSDNDRRVRSFTRHASHSINLRRRSRDIQAAQHSETDLDAGIEAQLRDDVAFVSQAMLSGNAGGSSSRRRPRGAPGPSSSAAGPSTLEPVPSGNPPASPSANTSGDVSANTSDSSSTAVDASSSAAPASPALAQVSRTDTASSTFTDGFGSEPSPPDASLTGTTGAMMDLLARRSHAGTPRAQTPAVHGERPGYGRMPTGKDTTAAVLEQRPTTTQDIHDIWCTLVLRMMLWLMLHDFHKKDVQISKSEVYNSRQAVYIL